MATREKSQAELAQEAQDEALARQLQMEADSAEAAYQQQQLQRRAQPPSAPPPPVGGAGNYPGAAARGNSAPQFQQPQTAPVPSAINPSAFPHLSMPHVRCTKCNAINTVQPSKMHLQQICGQCQKLLPPTVQQTGSRPPVHAPGTNFTGSSNSASAAGGAVPPAPSPPSNNATAPAAGGILQGQVQSVQARCGQCQAINALPVQSCRPGTSVSFKCGQCQAINKVTM